MVEFRVSNILASPLSFEFILPNNFTATFFCYKMVHGIISDVTLKPVDMCPETFLGAL